MEKKPTPPITSGLVVSLVLIVLSIVAYLTGIEQDGWYRWVSLLILCIAVILVVINFGKQSDNNVTFGNLFAYGFKTSAVVTCIMIVFSIAWFLIFPEMKEKAIEAARKQMEQKQQLSEEQIESAIAMTRKTFTVFLIIGLIFFYLVIGVISSLIGAAIAKKNPQTPFQNQL
jgi:uncharacterized membrane protein YciS (DUF1049 family)